MVDGGSIVYICLEFLLGCSLVTLPPVSAVFANYSGDILVGSLFPIHSHEFMRTRLRDQCGHLQAQDGVLPLEALLYTLDEINSSDFLPGFTLGTIALDTCDSDTHALGQAVEFVKILVTRATQEDVAFECADNSVPRLKPGVEDFSRVVGVVGGSSSSVSIAVANLLRLFYVPQISYLSTSPDLSNKDTFNYFQRTVPSDVNQAQAIVEILNRFNWTYISMLYDDSNYGEKLSAEFEKFAEKSGICLATRQRISVSNGNQSEQFDDLIRNILTKPDAKAVVVFSYRNTAEELFYAAGRANIAGKFVFIGSDGWSGRSFPQELDGVLKGSITVQPLALDLPGFDSYFQSLSPLNISKTRNPWFHEYWEDTYDCTFLENTTGTKNSKRKICTGKEDSKTKPYLGKMYNLHYVRWSVLAFAHALKNMHTDWCNGTLGLCPAITPNENPVYGKMLQKYVENVTFFDALLDKNFSFVDKVDGPPRYTIFSYNRQAESFEWKTIGSFSGVQGEERINFSNKFEYVLTTNNPYPPSRCSDPCSQGQAMKLLETDKCCWICTNCSKTEYLSDPNTCTECDKGHKPNQLRNECVKLKLTSTEYSNGFSIAALTCSCIGVVATLFVAAVFTKHRKTPVIKAAGKELSYILLLGIFVSYLSAFVILWRPDVIICGFKRFVVGFSYTLCYAPILVKTNRIARIFNSISGPRKPKYISPLSQVIMTSILIGIEIIIALLWIGVDNPSTTFDFQENENVLLCTGEKDLSYLTVFIYPFLLLVTCAIYAFKTRKAPDGFSETRFIAFTSYTTCVIWLAFIPFYFSTQQHLLRPFILCLSLFVSATVALCCLFLPKLHIIMFRPDKNTKDAIMQRKRRTSSMSASQGGNSIHSPMEGYKFRPHHTSSSSGPPMDDILEVISPASSSVWTVGTSLQDISSYQPDDDSGVFSGVGQPTHGGMDGSIELIPSETVGSENNGEEHDTTRSKDVSDDVNGNGSCSIAMEINSIIQQGQSMSHDHQLQPKEADSPELYELSNKPDTNESENSVGSQNNSQDYKEYPDNQMVADCNRNSTIETTTQREEMVTDSDHGNG